MQMINDKPLDQMAECNDKLLRSANPYNGVNLIPLATFALDAYKDTDCSAFAIKFNTDYDTKDLSLDMMITAHLWKKET